MQISDETIELLLDLLRRQAEDVDNLVRYLTCISDCAEIDSDLEEWFKRWSDRLDNADDAETSREARLLLWEHH